MAVGMALEEDPERPVEIRGEKGLYKGTETEEGHKLSASGQRRYECESKLKGQLVSSWRVFDVKLSFECIGKSYRW